MVIGARTAIAMRTSGIPMVCIPRDEWDETVTSGWVEIEERPIQSASGNFLWRQMIPSSQQEGTIRLQRLGSERRRKRPRPHNRLLSSYEAQVNLRNVRVLKKREEYHRNRNQEVETVERASPTFPSPFSWRGIVAPSNVNFFSGGYSFDDHVTIPSRFNFRVTSL
jgi:hypothetical protein